MSRVAYDAMREERIDYEIIVDAYSPEEPAMGWYSVVEAVEATREAVEDWHYLENRGGGLQEEQQSFHPDTPVTINHAFFVDQFYANSC